MALVPLAMAGCGSGTAGQLAAELARSSQASRRDLLEASRASLAREEALLASVGFSRFLELFPGDAEEVDVRLDLAEAQLDAAQPGAAEVTLGRIGPGPRDPLQRARASYLQARAFLGRAVRFYPHLESGARSMQELHLVFQDLLSNNRPDPDFQEEALRQRLLMEDLIARSVSELEQASRIIAETSKGDKQLALRATIVQALARSHFLLRNRARAILVLEEFLASASAPRTMRDAVLLLESFFFAEDGNSQAAFRALDEILRLDTSGSSAAVAKGADLGPTAAPGVTGGGSGLTEALQLVFRRVVERVTRQTTLRARLARGVLLLGQGSGSGEVELKALLPDLVAGGEATLARSARFALAARDQLTDSKATIARLQSLLPELVSDPELESAARLAIAQYPFLELALNQPPVRPQAERWGLYRNLVDGVRRALVLARSGGFPDPNLDARFLVQMTASPPATLAIPLQRFEVIRGVPLDLDLSGKRYVALPGRTADVFHFGTSSHGNGPLEPRLRFRLASGSLPAGLQLTTSGRLVGQTLDEAGSKAEIGVGRASIVEDSAALEISVRPLGLVDPETGKQPFSPVVRASPKGVLLRAAGGRPPYRFRVSRVTASVGAPAPAVTLEPSTVQPEVSALLLAEFAFASPARVIVELSDASGATANEPLILVPAGLQRSEPSRLADAFSNLVLGDPVAPLRLPPTRVGEHVRLDFGFLTSLDQSASELNLSVRSGPTWLTPQDGQRLVGSAGSIGVESIRVEFTERLPGGLIERQRWSRFLDLLVEPAEDFAATAPLMVFAPVQTGLAFLLGTPAVVQLAALGSDSTFTWSLDSGSVPPGLSLDSSGLLSGTPGETGTFTALASVTDGLGRAVTTTLEIRVTAAILQTQSTTAFPHFLQVADFDGDGRLDLVGAECGGEADFRTASIPCELASIGFFKGLGNGQLLETGRIAAALLSAPRAAILNLRRPPLTSLEGTPGRTTPVIAALEAGAADGGSLALFGVGAAGRLERLPGVLLPVSALSGLVGVQLGVGPSPSLIAASTQVGGRVTFLRNPFVSTQARAELRRDYPLARTTLLDASAPARTVRLLLQRSVPELVRRRGELPGFDDPGDSSMSSVVIRVPLDDFFEPTPDLFPPLLDFDTGLPGSVAVGQFDGDGYEDLVYPDSYLARLGAEGPTRLDASPGRALRDALFVVSGDFDGDRKLDAAFASAEVSLSALNRDETRPVNAVSIALGDGLGGFHSLSPVSADSTIVGLAKGDFDSDGREDLVVSTTAGVQLWRLAKSSVSP